MSYGVVSRGRRDRQATDRRRVRVRERERERKRRESEFLPNAPLPKRRPDLVVEGGGGGFWICEAVGALDWRIE